MRTVSERPQPALLRQHERVMLVSSNKSHRRAKELLPADPDRQHLFLEGADAKLPTTVLSPAVQGAGGDREDVLRASGYVVHLARGESRHQRRLEPVQGAEAVRADAVCAEVGGAEVGGAEAETHGMVLATRSDSAIVCEDHGKTPPAREHRSAAHPWALGDRAELVSGIRVPGAQLPAKVFARSEHAHV